MPLNITPVSYIQAHYTQVNASNVFDDFHSHHVWIADITPYRDIIGEVSYTTRGFISTTRSMLEGHHNCDNLQLDGHLYDFRGIPGWKYMSSYFTGGKDMTLALPYGSTFYTVDHLYQWGETRQEYYRTATGAEICSYFESLPDGSYFYIAMPQTGANFPSNYYWTCPVKRVIRYASNFCYIKTGAVMVNMNGYRYDELGLEIVILRARQYMTSPEFAKIKQVRATDLFSGQNHSSSTGLTDLYRDQEQEWLTSLMEYTKLSYDFGTLHYRAVGKITPVDVNGLAYVSDLKKILSDLKGTVELLSGRVSLDTISKAFLSYKYGMRLTLSDTKEYLEAFKKQPGSGVSATEEFLSDVKGAVSCTSTVRYSKHDTVFDEIREFFRYLDLTASPKNLWDLIPYSFVVDWFVNVGGFLERLDALDVVSHLNVNAVFDSYSHIGNVVGSRIIYGIVGSIQFKRYVRKCHNDATFPLIVPQQPSVTSHWLEGTALIIQRLVQ